MEKVNQRILGYDFARALAIIGMIFVNFKTVMVSKDQTGTLYNVIDFMSGKAAALFVVLAGVGMTLMYKGASKHGDLLRIKQAKTTLFKRSVFLFIIGMSYFYIWPADILHYYGFYIAFGVLFLSTSRKALLKISIALIVLFALMCFLFDYEKGWNWESLEYSNFFTPVGFIRNMFFNGFHPVVPWSAFLLTGIWVGRLNLKKHSIRGKVMGISLLIYGITKLISVFLVQFIKIGEFLPADEIIYLFGTSPMPPLPLYMISGSSLAVFIITLSVSITEKYPANKVVAYLNNTGKMALSLYFMHVIVGMGVVDLVFGGVEQMFNIRFIAIYASIFSIFLIAFSHLWINRFRRGPLELLMRKIVG